MYGSSCTDGRRSTNRYCSGNTRLRWISAPPKNASPVRWSRANPSSVVTTSNAVIEYTLSENATSRKAQLGRADGFSRNTTVPIERYMSPATSMRPKVRIKSIQVKRIVGMVSWKRLSPRSTRYVCASPTGLPRMMSFSSFIE